MASMDTTTKFTIPSFFDMDKTAAIAAKPAHGSSFPSPRAAFLACVTMARGVAPPGARIALSGPDILPFATSILDSEASMRVAPELLGIGDGDVELLPTGSTRRAPMSPEERAVAAAFALGALKVGAPRNLTGSLEGEAPSPGSAGGGGRGATPRQ